MFWLLRRSKVGIALSKAIECWSSHDDWWFYQMDLSKLDLNVIRLEQSEAATEQQQQWNRNWPHWPWSEFHFFGFSLAVVQISLLLFRPPRLLLIKWLFLSLVGFVRSLLAFAFFFFVDIYLQFPAISIAFCGNSNDAMTTRKNEKWNRLESRVEEEEIAATASQRSLNEIESMKSYCKSFAALLWATDIKN